ncbi:MAG: hypothetical protein JOZ55_03650, partial [Alphaproteobacteria bacterium]|nr:hypothetical protein [Alphaproteobacteria bacterium]
MTSTDTTRLPAGIFLVRDDSRRGRKIITAHAMRPLAERARRETRGLLERDGRTVRFQLHSPKSFRSARTLEALTRRVAGGAIVADPTGVFERSSALIQGADALRTALGNKIDRVLFDSTRRTLFVVLNDSAFSGSGAAFRVAVGQAMQIISAAISDWQAKAPAEFKVAVRVGFEPPADTRLVAVDDRSRRGRAAERVSRSLSRLRLLAGGAAISAVAAAVPGAALAQDGDMTAAVSQPNATLLTQATFVNVGHADDVRYDAGGDVTLPLGHDFGIQADAGGGTHSYWGFGGHLFWRDPSWGLLGAVVSDESMENTRLTRYAGEAELYLDAITLAGRVGYQDGDVRHGMFGRADVDFFITPSFELRGGFEGSPGIGMARAGLEFQPAPDALAGLSLFADASFGGATNIMTGIKFHFGAPAMSLIDRQRHEDPELSIFNLVALAKA